MLLQRCETPPRHSGRNEKGKKVILVTTNVWHSIYRSACLNLNFNNISYFSNLNNAEQLKWYRKCRTHKKSITYLKKFFRWIQNRKLHCEASKWQTSDVICWTHLEKNASKLIWGCGYTCKETSQ